MKEALHPPQENGQHYTQHSAFNYRVSSPPLPRVFVDTRLRIHSFSRTQTTTLRLQGLVPTGQYSLVGGVGKLVKVEEEINVW